MDDISSLVFNDFINIVYDSCGYLEKDRVKLVIAEEHENSFVFDVDFKVFSISNAAKCVAEDAASVINLAVFVEFFQVAFTDVACFAMLGVDENGGFTVAFQLDVTRVTLVACEDDVAVGEGLNEVLVEDVFGHFTFLRAVTGEVVVELSECIIDGRNFMMHCMRIQSCGDNC